MKKAEGTLQCTFLRIIPGILFFSSSRITNGRYVDYANSKQATGRVFGVHILPFFAFTFILPRIFLKTKKVL